MCPFVRLSILMDMTHACKLTCMNEPAAQIKITLGSSATWPFFLIGLKKNQKEQFIKTKHVDSELCCHRAMTDELSLEKRKPTVSFLRMQK